MHNLEKAFINLLRNHIGIIPDKYIFAGSRYIPNDLTPCITVVCSDETFIKRDYFEKECKQYIRKKYASEIWINIWCNTEEERQSIIDDVHNRILQAESNHYTTCINYINETGYCKIFGGDCKSLTGKDSRSYKNQCPDLTIYKSFFKHYHITRNTFNINSILDLDELDTSEPLLRTIFRLNMDYYTYHLIGGRSFDDFQIESNKI